MQKLLYFTPKNGAKKGFYNVFRNQENFKSKKLNQLDFSEVTKDPMYQKWEGIYKEATSL